MAALACAASAGAQRHSLLPHVRVGDVFRYEFRGTYQVADKESTYTAVFEMAIGGIAANGNLTFNNKQMGAEISQGGQIRKLPDSSTSTVVKPNGVFVSVEPPYASPEQARFSRLMQIVLSETPVKTGDSWSWNLEPTSGNGNIGFAGKGECLAFEMKAGVRCAHVRLTGKETSGEKPAAGSMEVWVSLKDGMPIEIKMDFSNVPLAPGALATYRAGNKRVLPSKGNP